MDSFVGLNQIVENFEFLDEVYASHLLELLLSTLVDLFAFQVFEEVRNDRLPPFVVAFKKLIVVLVEIDHCF